MSGQDHIAWIAADWGTTNLRIWALDAANTTVLHSSSARGMNTLAPDEFEGALLELIDAFLPENRTIPVIICGMAGSRQGWREAPYRETPCAPPGVSNATIVEPVDPRLSVHILPGIKQMAPADVMRGEETQIAGFLSDHHSYTGLICLPGTHTKWVVLEEGIITRFRTCMTGEVFALLKNKSVLQHSLAKEGFCDIAYEAAVKEITQSPERLTSELFGIRASSLIAGQTPEVATGRLSGLLIGAELAAVALEFDLQNTAILGTDQLSRVYGAALGILGYPSMLLDAESYTVKGLTLAYEAHLKETK
ncbi:2-dehydro-3-deoxygalactonokinase [Roseibium alexandrii]|uniref:2-dehydro-3-deoxygalactonokinase n=1 Tax=Roseibium alexandrii TaxID=388408 RepID=UPI003751BBB8